jgi:hypothetical protein
MSAIFRLVRVCVGMNLAMSRSPVQGILPKCLNIFTVSDNSEWKQARGPNHETHRKTSRYSVMFNTMP